MKRRNKEFKERKKPRLLPRLTGILLVCSLIVWLAGMAGATYYLAMTVRSAIINSAIKEASDWVSYASSMAEFRGVYNAAADNGGGGYLSWLYKDCLTPSIQLIRSAGNKECLTPSIQLVRSAGNYVGDGGVWYMDEGVWEWMNVEWESFTGVYDREGNPIMVNEPSLLLTCEDEDGGRSYLYARADEGLDADEYLWMYSQCRADGWLEEDGHLELLELSILVESWGVEPYWMSIYLREGIPNGYAEADRTLEEYVPEGKELVTIEAGSARKNSYSATAPVTALGRTYDDLGAFLGDCVKSRAENAGIMKDGLWNDTLLDLIITYVDTVYLGDTSSISLTEDDLEGMERVLLATSIRCSPLLTAMDWLKGVYIITFLLALIWPLAVRGMLKEHVVWPLENVQSYAKNGLSAVPPHPSVSYRFREIDAVIGSYNDAAEGRRLLQGENVRLTRAVEYARKAEEDRRLMTSNLAHELKTPLAVVHSYAEGLQEHIAEEKREQYLDVILSETERMDSVVLDMLALSRLESGKARLERTDFDLNALVRERFDALKRQAEEKRLQVTLALEGEQIVYADEERIGQVVSNYASNAVRYTPEGGSITARVYRNRQETVCEVENTCDPLPEEALTKVWESFYRVSKSRSQRGTGLGLTIAKSIVELHGGWVSVRNTGTGVAFSFGLKR